MMMAKSILALVAIVVMVASTANYVQASISCTSAVITLAPCLPFLAQGAANPSPLCCVAVANEKAMATTKPDLQALCECLKNAAGSFKVDTNKAGALPKLCGVSLPFPITADIDCSKIGWY